MLIIQARRGREKLENQIEMNLKANVENLIKKVQKEFKSDIFGFGEMIKRNHPSVWEKIKDNWVDIFPNLDIKVNSEIIISGSGLSRKTEIK